MKEKLQELRTKLDNAHEVEKEVYDRIKKGFVLAKDIHGTDLTERAIDFMTLEIAKQIKGDYASGFLKNLAIISPMDGAFTTASKVQHYLSHFDCPFMPGTIQVSSYHGTEAGRLILNSKSKVEVAQRDVVIVEDIIDTGNTIYLLRKYLLMKGARSVHIACLINKEQPRPHPITIRYPGFIVDASAFPVGAMMDYRRMFRDELNIYMINRDLLPRKGSAEDGILDSISKLNKQIYNLNRLDATLKRFPFFSNRDNRDKNKQLETCTTAAYKSSIISSF